MTDIDVTVVGQVYNADYQQIRQLYIDEDVKMCQSLVGDFYIKVVDHIKQIVLHASDFASTHSAKFMPRNTVFKIALDGRLLSVNESYSSRRYLPFAGIKPPRRNTYDMLFEAIDKAVSIRHDDNAVVALSSGHDSGSITAALLRKNKTFDVITSPANEDRRVLDLRLSMIRGWTNKKTVVDAPETKQQARVLVEQCMRDTGYDINQATAMLSHYHIAKHIEGKTLISGLGADEFYAQKHDELLRMFLTEAMIAYNHYNIDARYPLLDYNVYCEYYNLDPRLRQGHKLPLEQYIKTLNLPVCKGNKHSFVVGQHLL